VKKKIVILIFFTLAIINVTAAGFWIWDIGRKTEQLAIRYENAEKMEKSLYENRSLKVTISKLEEELSAVKVPDRKNDKNLSLKMTKDVLLLFEQNRIKVISYRLEGEKNKKETREELVITAEGETAAVLKLIYDLSFSKEELRIKFVSVNAGFPGRPAAFVIRVTYA